MKGLMKRNALLFAGQAAQTVGMGRDLAEQFPTAAESFQRADDVLGRKLSEIAWNGPSEDLTKTSNCQPALFVHGLACLAVLRSGLCRQRGRLLSPATLSSRLPFVLARLRLLRQSFHAQLSKFHRRSSAAANIHLRSRVPLSPFLPILRGRLSQNSRWNPGVVWPACGVPAALRRRSTLLPRLI